MVEVGAKPDQKRRAIASGKIFLDKNTIDLIQNEEIKKGNVLTTAQIAGIQAVKNTSSIIPPCPYCDLADSRTLPSAASLTLPSAASPTHFSTVIYILIITRTYYNAAHIIKQPVHLMLGCIIAGLSDVLSISDLYINDLFPCLKSAVFQHGDDFWYSWRHVSIFSRNRLQR